VLNFIPAVAIFFALIFIVYLLFNSKASGTHLILNLFYFTQHCKLATLAAELLTKILAKMLAKIMQNYSYSFNQLNINTQ